jgi:hypothetical protein
MLFGIYIRVELSLFSGIISAGLEKYSSNYYKEKK